LRAHLAERGLRGNDLLFPSPGGGNGRARGSLREQGWSNKRFHRDVWQPTVARAGLTQAWGGQQLRFHDLRHTHATWLLAERRPISAVAARLGHADPVVTLRVYAHVMRMVDRGELTADDLHDRAGTLAPVVSLR
jgi:integrase